MINTTNILKNKIIKLEERIKYLESSKYWNHIVSLQHKLILKAIEESFLYTLPSGVEVLDKELFLKSYPIKVSK